MAIRNMQQRPDKDQPASLAFDSQAVHAGNVIDATTGAIRTPIVMANSYRLPDDPSSLDWSDSQTLFYTRNSGHNQLCLERKLAAMERGEEAAVFSTGVAALHSIFFTFLKSGDHVVVSDVTYEAVWRLFNELLPERYGIEATFVDISDLAAVREAVRPNTKLIHAETIANPTTKVADVQAIAKIAHDAGAMVSIDATFTPPPMFRGLEHDADLVVHALTKYINGHGDAMGGAVIGRAELIRRLKGDALVDVGGSISPFQCVADHARFSDLAAASGSAHIYRAEGRPNSSTRIQESPSSFSRDCLPILNMSLRRANSVVWGMALSWRLPSRVNRRYKIASWLACVSLRRRYRLATTSL